ASHLGPYTTLFRSVQVRHEAVDRQRGGQPDCAQLVFDARRLAVARAIDRPGEEQRLRVGVVAPGHQLREAVGAEVELHAVELGPRYQLGVVLQAQFVAGGARPADVRHHARRAHAEVVVPAKGFNPVFALVEHAADQRLDVVGGAAGEGVVAVDAGGGDLEADFVRCAAGTVEVADVDFELVGGVDLLGLGVEQVQGAGPRVRRAILQRRHHAVALQPAGAAQRLDAVGIVGAGGDARTPVVADRLPRLVKPDLVLLDRRARVRPADRNTELAVGELVDVAGIEAAAVVADVGGRAERVLLVATADDDHRVAEVQRARGLHVDRAGQALSDQSGVR